MTITKCADWKIEELIKPWERGEVKFRVGSTTKDKTKALPLAYVDARSVMDRLDKVVGFDNWQDRYEFNGARTICYLTLRVGEEWLTKSDGAGDSDIEGEKGGLSDAFKRAAVKWGMGRELYEMKCKWMPVDEYKQLVGDPWDFVINNKQKAEKSAQKVVQKAAPKAETPEDVCNRLIFAVNKLQSALKIVDFERVQSVMDARDKLYIDAPELSKKVDDAIKQRFEDLVKVA